MSDLASSKVYGDLIVTRNTDIKGALNTSTLTVTGLTASRALITDSSSNVTVSTVTSTELEYVSGVTSAIQTQLNSKSATTHNHTLDSLSNVTITSNSSGEILKWNGTAWVNNTLAEAGIAPTSHAVNATTYGVGDATNYGHVKVGSGITSSSGIISVDAYTNAELPSDGTKGEIGVDATGIYVKLGTSSKTAAVGSHTHTYGELTSAPSTWNPSLHAGTHLPGGSDALTTAAAVSLSDSTTNTEGNAISFARSNHTHAITGFSLSTHDHNKFLNMSDGTNVAVADGTSDTFTFAQNGGLTVLVDATNDKVTYSHADTSSVGNLTAAARTYVTGLTFDTYGHVTAVATGSETVVDTNTVTTLTAGSAITISDGGTGGNHNYTVNHADTSSQASVDNSNGTVIQDVTLDTYGHITALGSYDLDGRYYTESEVETARRDFLDNYVVSGCTVTPTATALQINIAVGVAFCYGKRYTPTSTNLTLTASTTQYIYINSSGTVTNSTTAPTGDYVDLATVTVPASGVIPAGNITDTRDIITNVNGKLTYDLYNDASSYAQTISSRGPGSGLLIKNAGVANALTIYDSDVSKDMFTIDGSGNTKLLNAADLIVYSDAGTTQKFLVDGATGNTTTVGYVEATKYRLAYGTTYITDFVTVYGGDTNGLGAYMQTGGSLIIGSGESGSAAYTNLGATSEELWLISDGAVQIQTNIQTAWASRKSFIFDVGGNLSLPTDPTSAMHAATKQYVDNVVLGLDVKASVVVATTANITLSGIQTIDGIAVVADDRVLVKNQTTASQNGIYLAKSGAWVRTTDADISGKVTPGMYCWVEKGTANADSGWLLTVDGTITLGTTALNFVQFSGAGQITDGNGITKSGNTLSVDAYSNAELAANMGEIGVTSTGIYTKLGTDAKTAAAGNHNHDGVYLKTYTESDTLASVTGRGATTSTASTFNGGLTTTTFTATGNITMNGTILSANVVNFLNGGSAQKLNTGGILTSDAYADASKVPANGIYSKGDIATSGGVAIGGFKMSHNATTNALDFRFVG